MGVYINRADNFSDMRGPCADGFHVPTSTEFTNLVNIVTSLGVLSNISIYLKLPLAGIREQSGGGGTSEQGSRGRYWSCNKYSSDNSNYLYIYSSGGSVADDRKSYGFSIRPFKNTSVTPDSGWTALYSDKIYHNSTLGLISLSSDGTNWITIADKNCGATTVWNNGNTLSEANCGKYYQWGNNYGFAWTGSITTSSTQVNAGSYGPGNYYSSSTFITRSSSPYNWDSSNNDNLRGGVSGVGGEYELKNAYIGGVPPLVLQQIFDFTTSDLHGYTNTKDPGNSYGLTINTSGHYCTGDGTGGAGGIWKTINASRYWGRIKFQHVYQVYGGVMVGAWTYPVTSDANFMYNYANISQIGIYVNNSNVAEGSYTFSLNTYYYLDCKFDNGLYTLILSDANLNALKTLTYQNSDTKWKYAGFGGWGGRNSTPCFRIHGYREAYDNN